MVKLFSLCKKLYIRVRRYYARPTGFTLTLPESKWDTPIFINGVRLETIHPFNTVYDPLFSLDEWQELSTADPTVGRSSAFIVEGFVNSEGQIFIGKFYKLKENDMNLNPTQQPVTQVEEKVQQSPTADFEQQFRDAVISLNNGLIKLHNLSNHINEFVDGVEQKFISPGN